MTTSIKALLALILACAVTAALAHGGATGIVKERMESMKAMGEETKALGAMVKHQAPFDAGRVEAAAALFASHARTAPALFPEGSLYDPSEADPEIWTRWPEFKARFRELESAAMALGHSSQSLEQMTPAFISVATTCKSCHDSFKRKK